MARNREQEYGGRVISYFGNPALYAGYLVFQLPLTLGVVCQLRRPKAKAVALGVFCLLAVNLVLTGSRAGWLGLGAGLVCFGLLALRRGSEARPLGMTATLQGGRATLSTGCFRRAWTYSQDRNRVSFESAPSGSSNCGGQAPGQQEENAYAALDGVNIVIFSEKGKRADLSGDSGTLTLERR